MALVKQNSWLFSPPGLHCNHRWQWQPASRACQLALHCTLGFREQKHWYSLFYRPIQAQFTARKKTFKSGVTCSKVISLTLKNTMSFTYTCKMNTGKLSFKMNIDKNKQTNCVFQQSICPIMIQNNITVDNKVFHSFLFHSSLQYMVPYMCSALIMEIALTSHP